MSAITAHRILRVSRALHKLSHAVSTDGDVWGRRVTAAKTEAVKCMLRRNEIHHKRLFEKPVLSSKQQCVKTHRNEECNQECAKWYGERGEVREEYEELKVDKGRGRGE